MKSQIISIQWIVQLSPLKADDTTDVCMVQGLVLKDREAVF